MINQSECNNFPSLDREAGRNVKFYIQTQSHEE